MIYYKKKSLIKKILINFKRREKKPSFAFLSFLKGFLGFAFCFLILLYSFCIFLLPKYIDEEAIEKVIDSYILKNTKLAFDVSGLQINPNYKLDLNLKADSLKLKDLKKSDVLIFKNLNIDINLFSLLLKNIDIDKFEADSIKLNTKFNKKNKYEFFEYFDFKNKTSKNDFKIKNINFEVDNFLFDLYDENIQKDFYIKTNRLKISTFDLKKNISILTNGEIKSSNHKISDFDLKLSIRLSEDSIGKFREKLLKLNRNPFYYADKFKFYSSTKVDLKINNLANKGNITGEVVLKDYSFNINNLQMPKNNLTLVFKNGKVYSDCDFKFLKNQYIKIKSYVTLAKKPYIEAKLNSNDINLADLRDILDVAGKIFNFKFNLNDIKITGLAKIDAYLKSDFKTINSNGKLTVLNAKLEDKKTGLVLNNIESDINFANNTVNILNTSAFINNAKFNLSGKIDSKTNVDIGIYSDEINIAQVLVLLKDLPFANAIMPKIKDYDFKSGLLKINTHLGGNLQNLVVKSNSNLTNFRANLKKYNLEFFIPKLELNFLQNDVIIPKTKLIVENIPLYINGKVINYKSKNPQTVLNIQSTLPKNNKFLTIKDKDAVLSAVLNIAQDKILISSCDISKIILITGEVQNLDTAPIFNNLKLNIPQKTALLIPEFENLIFETTGSLVLNGKIEKPNILGNLNLHNLSLKDIGLNVSNLILNIKNSEFYLNISKGKIFDFDFDLVSSAKIENNKLIIDFAQINSQYINLENFEKYLKNSNSIKKFNYEIKNLKGNVSVVETADIVLNSLSFQGEIKDDVLNIQKFEAQSLNGDISGKTKIDLLKQKISSQLNLKELNIRQLSPKLKELSIATSGKLSANINANFIGFNLEQILNTFDGNIKFNITNGELSQFAKLERFLQAGNILSQNILKLNLNSMFSTLTKQNTGDFKIIEGDIDIKNSIANMNYINSQGSNMSFIICGDFNLLNQNMQAKILGRIPNSIITPQNDIGKDNSSFVEKHFTTFISNDEYEKIPPLAYQVDNIPTREFVVLVDGVVKNINSIRDFKWAMSR